MEHWQSGIETVLGRISYVYNKDTYSDINFLVGSRNATAKFYAHKLLLSLSSPVFADMFYGHLPLSKTIEVPDVSPRAFGLMLEYLYTDRLNLKSVEDACQTYYAAKKYKIDHLQKKCQQYALTTDVSFDNVCALYEISALLEVPDVLKSCSDIIEKNTKAVLNSAQFKNSKLSTVEAIIKKDTLNIDSEVELIDAIMNWGRNECKRRNMVLQSKNIRNCIEPLMQHIRFLSLSHSEFATFVQSNDILNSKEVCAITFKLTQPDVSYMPLPNYICLNRERRSTAAYIFQLPLTDKNVKGVHQAFRADMISTLQIEMISSQVKITGVVLHIKRKSTSPNEMIPVLIRLSNRFHSHDEVIKTHIVNDSITLKFSKSLYIPENQSAAVNITVEDLHINRCLSCKKVEYHFNNEKNIRFNVNLSTNRKSESDFIPFLVKEFMFLKC